MKVEYSVTLMGIGMVLLLAFITYIGRGPAWTFGLWAVAVSAYAFFAGVVVLAFWIGERT